MYSNTHINKNSIKVKAIVFYPCTLGRTPASSFQYNSKILWQKWFIYATDSKKFEKSGKCCVQIRNSGNPEIRIRFQEKSLTQNFPKIPF